MKKNIFIIGGGGFIGSYLSNIFFNKGYRVFVIDTFVNHYPEKLFSTYRNSLIKYRFEHYLKNTKILRVDARNKFELLDIFNKFSPNLIINFAALPIANLSSTLPEESFSSILETNMNLIEILKRKNFKGRFCYISSSMVYGNFTKSKINENENCNPISPYGAVKLAGEKLTIGMCNSYNINYTIIRPSAVYGGSDINGRVIQACLENYFDKKNIILNGKSTKIDFTYIDDICNGIYKALTNINGINETFNITYGKSRTLEDLSKIIFKNLIDVNIEFRDHEKGVPFRGTLDISKARKLINYNPKYSLENGVASYIKFLKEII